MIDPTPTGAVIVCDTCPAHGRTDAHEFESHLATHYLAVRAAARHGWIRALDDEQRPLGARPLFGRRGVVDICPACRRDMGVSPSAARSWEAAAS